MYISSPNMSKNYNLAWWHLEPTFLHSVWLWCPYIYTLHDIHRCIEIDRCSNSNDLYSDLLSLPMRFLIDSIIFFPFFPLFPPTPLNNKWLNQLTKTQLTNWRTQWSKKFPYFFTQMKITQYHFMLYSIMPCINVATCNAWNL